ncbi:PaaX family transcriptional regulator C-terminal domain-containing protein [Rhodococcus jostii]|uniref:PaaX family transcriptional regulator n=1 Tax=Rhodococcus jostii TaxID=132919 RepID=UPI001967720B|nr:PaaX family transcriptional regulator C-terminal domain-containing protein [Rhodococcus jostii]
MTNAANVHNESVVGVKPQSVLLTVLGQYVLGRDVVVSTSSILDALSSLGVGEHATRSALNRMVNGALLTRHRYGRNAYVGLTPRARAILQDGHVRIWRTGAVESNWDGTWTLLSFSFPDSWQRQRHELRARLQWAGFGSLQGGLWISPSSRDVADVLDGIEGADRVRVFYSRAESSMDVPAMLRDAWDIEEIAHRYERFLGRWGGPGQPGPASALGTQLLLVTEWLDVIRQDPRLPLDHLPADWPASPAQQLFRDLHDRLDPVARAEAAERFDLRPTETGHE